MLDLALHIPPLRLAQFSAEIPFPEFVLKLALAAPIRQFLGSVTGKSNYTHVTCSSFAAARSSTICFCVFLWTRYSCLMYSLKSSMVCLELACPFLDIITAVVRLGRFGVDVEANVGKSKMRSLMGPGGSRALLQKNSNVLGLFNIVVRSWSQ